MKVKVKVILGPTDKYPGIAQSNSQVESFGAEKETLYGWVDNPIRTEHTLHHLYFLSTEDIVKGEDLIPDRWYINTYRGNSAPIHNLNLTNNGYLREIIGTTDKTITKYKAIEIDGKLVAGMGYYPKPSKELIEEYCKLGGFDEIMVEYEVYEDFLKPVSGVIPARYYNSQRVKIGDDNIMNTSPVKESWTKEEVEQLLFKYAEDEHAWFSCKSEADSFNTWIEENL